MSTENKLRVPPFTREDIKAMVEEMNDHVFIDLKGTNFPKDTRIQFDNGETYQKLLNLPEKKIVVFVNYSISGEKQLYGIAQSISIYNADNFGVINCNVHYIAKDGTPYNDETILEIAKDGKIGYVTI